MKRYYLILLFFSILIVIGLAVFKLNHSSPQSSSQNKFVSDSYGYSLILPQNWTAKEIKHSYPSKLNPDKDVSYSELEGDGIKIKIFFEGDFDHGFEPWVFDSKKDLIIDGKMTNVTYLKLKGNPNLWAIYTIDNFHDFRIEANFNPADEYKVDHILSTFEF